MLFILGSEVEMKWKKKKGENPVVCSQKKIIKKQEN